MYLLDTYLAFAGTVLKKSFQCLVWYTPMTLALRKLMQEDAQLEDSLGWTVRPSWLHYPYLLTCVPLFISSEDSATVLFPNRHAKFREGRSGLSSSLFTSTFPQLAQGCLLVAGTIMSYFLGV